MYYVLICFISREDNKVKRTISLRQNREKITSANSSIPSNLISDLLEISKSFKRHRTPLQKSASAMSLRLFNIEESDNLLRPRREPNHENFIAPLPEKSCSVPHVNEGYTNPQNGKTSDYYCSTSSSETEYDSYKTHDDPTQNIDDDAGKSDGDGAAVNHEDIDFELDEVSNRSSCIALNSPGSYTEEASSESYKEASVSDATETLANSCPLDDDTNSKNGNSTSSDSCPSDSSTSVTDSCPSDSDSCPSDSDEEVSETDQFPGSADPTKFVPYTGERRQRGRMSVITPPSISSVELNSAIKKRISKSCGDLSEISDEFIDHLKTLRPVEDSVFEEFEMLSQQDRNYDNDDFRPGKLKRSSSQTITDRELKTIHETKNIWNVPEMVKSSKIALAILFIGARMGSVVQNNLGYHNNITAEEVSHAPVSTDNKARSQSMATTPKNRIGRNFSFSMKNRNNILSNKKVTRTKISLKEDILG